MSGIRTEATQVVIQTNGLDGLKVKQTGVVEAGAPGVSGNDLVVMGQSKITLGAAQATTSGTFKDFAIPAWAKRVTVILEGVSTNGTSQYILQLNGEVTGYTGGASSGNSASTNINGLLVNTNVVATSLLSGQAVLALVNGTTWVASGVVCAAANVGTVIGGAKTLAAVLSTVRLTTVNGTDIFDAGQVNVSWE